MLGLLCVGSASGGFISFRLGQAAATRDLDLAARFSAERARNADVPGNQGTEKTMELGPEAPLADHLSAAREELRLIEEANAAVTRGDFANALSPLLEHERRFQRGWLSRERESLSVKAIDGLLISEPASGRPPYSAASEPRNTIPELQRRSALSSSRRAFRSRE